MEEEEDGHDGVQQVINSTQVFNRWGICLQYYQHKPYTNMKSLQNSFSTTFLYLLPGNVLFEEAAWPIRGKIVLMLR